MGIPLRPDPLAMAAMERRSLHRACAAMFLAHGRHGVMPQAVAKNFWQDDDIAGKICGHRASRHDSACDWHAGLAANGCCAGSISVAKRSVARQDQSQGGLVHSARRDCVCNWSKLVTYEEAERIARGQLLPGEPRADEITAWRASRPPREPARRERGLDTIPAPPPIDWALVIRQTILGERAHMTEAIGGAIAEYGDGLGDELLADVEGMIAAAVAELREEFSRQIDQLRTELSGRIDSTQTHGAELKAQLDAIIAKRKRAKAAKPNGSTLLLPSPNGHASDPQ